jgi:hypothetical protein
MAIAVDADQWAVDRVGVFFPGYPAAVTGQCVALDKWFLQEMTSVPNPQSARGHAKDFGQTLVNQGHADIVSEANRKEGDIVVWKQDGGGYGHIGVFLSGERVFECNVGIKGTPSMQVPQPDGSSVTVYSARIDPLYQSFRVGPPTFYRVKSYQGDNSMEELAQLRLDQLNNIRRAIYLEPVETNEIQDILDRVALVNGDYDNIWANLFGEKPTEADYAALRKGPKDALYHLNNVAKEKLSGGSGDTYTAVAEVDGQPTLYTKDA